MGRCCGLLPSRKFGGGGGPVGPRAVGSSFCISPPLVGVLEGSCEAWEFTPCVSSCLGGHGLASVIWDSSWPEVFFHCFWEMAASGSLTLFQSWRVARPQDASKAPKLVLLLSSSARSYLDVKKQRMVRPVSEVAGMETWLRPAGRYVDPVFQHSRRHVGFVRGLVKAGPVGFVETAVEHDWSLLRCQEDWAQRFIIDARASNRGEGLCHVEFQGALDDAKDWFVSSTEFKNVFHHMRILGWLQAFFALPVVFASEVGCTGKNVSATTTCSRFVDIPCSNDASTLPLGFDLAMFFSQDFLDHFQR